MIRRSLLAAPALAFVAAVLAVVPAFAHAHPKTMAPDKDSTVSTPAQISIVFTEDLEGKFSTLSLKDSKGTVVSTAHSVLDPSDQKHLTLAVPPLAPGTYVVHWVSVATDSHRAEGDYTFTVK